MGSEALKQLNRTGRSQALLAEFLGDVPDDQFRKWVAMYGCGLRQEACHMVHDEALSNGIRFTTEKYLQTMALLRDIT